MPGFLSSFDGEEFTYKGPKAEKKVAAKAIGDSIKVKWKAGEEAFEDYYHCAISLSLDANTGALTFFNLDSLVGRQLSASKMNYE
eukprot:CAMPEP_0170508816 /NCGR_PEP_ID=MMETSP0208-20121228/63525_1 /TAXON_ID=197538 /ORGANISM="Strombidium inclinatum, Strain S3" /LENGTH=84 /DNA_ID=CAMNT_0010791937 /DNA_START=885 /DNA_END=1139 /DNA_ORIENTATION=-